MEPIIRSQVLNEKYFEEKCFITEILNSTSHPEISISKAKVRSGVTTVLHKLEETEEKYYILSGQGEMEINGKIVGEVRSGDLVIIPKNVSQRIKNIGSDDLVFLRICTPRFEVANYEGVMDS